MTRIRRALAIAAVGLAGVMGTTSCLPVSTVPGAPTVSRLANQYSYYRTNGAAISVAWTEAPTGGSTITGWRISRNGFDVTGGGPYSTVLPASASQFTFTLLHDTPYTISIQAINSIGTGQATYRTVTPSVGYGAGTPCSTAGDFGSVANEGNVVCDGFTMLEAGQVAAWNATGIRTPGGVNISVTAACSSNGYTPLLQVLGALSQIGVSGRAISAPQDLPCGAAPVRYTEFVPGRWSAGKATLKVYGDSSPDNPNDGLSSTVIGVNVR